MIFKTHPVQDYYLPGGSHIDMVYVRICACLFRRFFAKFGIPIVGVFDIRDKGSQIEKLGVFWANYGKKHPIWANLGAFLFKMVYWWVGNSAKIGIEKVRFSKFGRHIHVQFWGEYPLRDYFRSCWGETMMLNITTYKLLIGSELW